MRKSQFSEAQTIGMIKEQEAGIPRRKDGKRNWPNELKARIVAATLVKDATVISVSKRYEITASTISDWRRMARMGIN